MWMVGGVVLVVLLMGAVMLSGRPSMSLLFAGLSPADQGMVVEELNKLGISAEYDANGNVQVPANKVNEARARLAVAQKLPSSGNLGYGALDAMNPMISPEVEREKIKAAIEGELANSIQSIAGVASARVHLTTPDSSPFARDSKPATASIIITERAGGRLSADQAEAIARLVQFGVSGLKPENITLVNEKGQTLYDGAQVNGSSGSADRKVTAEIEEARRREQDLQRKLDAAFGAGNTIVSIPLLTLNFDKVSETSVQRGPSSKPVTREEVTERMNDAMNGNGMGEAGAPSNIGAPAGDAPGQEKEYEGTQRREEFEINETTRSIQRSAGTLEAMTINVMVNAGAIDNVAPVQQYVQSYLGPLAQQPDRFAASVTSVEFDGTQAQAAQQATAAAAAQSRNEQIMSLLPIVALIVIGFLLLRAIGKSSPKVGAAPVSRESVEVALPGGGMMTLPAAAFQALPEGAATLSENEKGEQVIAIEGGELANALHALAQSNAAQVPIEDIPDKVNIPLEQIKKMAIAKPEAVANLIKTWVLEERR